MSMFHSNEAEEFKQENLSPFDEMMISWNGQRPKTGVVNIYARVFLNEWTPWLKYGAWESHSQSSTQEQAGSVKVYQDAFEVLEGKKATGFHIKADEPMRLHVYTNGESEQGSASPLGPVFLQVDGLSQIALAHPRNRDLCSPTSTAAVVRYLTRKTVDPIQFATSVRDHGFDIFGNWVLNVAESSIHLGPAWNAWVERLYGIGDIYQRLLLGTPVVVSVRGPLPGSAQPYAKGHLLVVTGLDPVEKEVHCMDPAFESDAKTHVRYKLDDFLAAWERRGKVAYVFEKKRP
ncbi:MAG: C39 family peptidase [Parachlamydiales bacterium]|nr:C39 family peptidase [Parachlamydiales bacterium]